jgi:hypothetical protein
MNEQEVQHLTHLLGEIRDNQKIQLQQQSDALALQREQFALVQKLAERHERIQDRAEGIQDCSADGCRTQSVPRHSPHRDSADHLSLLADLPLEHPRIFAINLLAEHRRGFETEFRPLFNPTGL